MERRLAAILAADVVGYSRLMGEDETGTLERLKALRRELVQPRIAEHKGRIVKLMGDGLLAEFPSVVEAIQCAVDIQQGMPDREPDLADSRRVKLRIGVNLGDIIVEGSDIYGDGVNVAARLEGLASPGGICVSGTVFDHVKGKIDLNFAVLGEQKVKNIPEPIRVYRVKLDGTVTSSPEEEVRDKAMPRLPDKPSIAVLPFTNLSGDQEQSYFSDGITEDIIAQLSRFPTLFVIARNSSFAYRDKAGDVTVVARELGVHYVVEGSVRKAANKVRINAQLVDGVTGHHLWAERYARDLEDIFAVQDEVTQTIVATLAGRLEIAGQRRARRKSMESLEAYDYVLRGNDSFYRFTKEDIDHARERYREAIELDPDCARAHLGLAWAELMDWMCHWAEAPDDSFERAFASAKKALSADDSDSLTHAILGELYLFRREYEQAQIHLGRALALNPNDADAIGIMGFLLTCLGRPQEGIQHFRTAKRLNPYQPDWCMFCWRFGIAQYTVGDYETAITCMKEIVSPINDVRAWLAASYAQVGRLDEARSAMEEFLRSAEAEAPAFPRPTLADWKAHWANFFPFKSDRDLEHLLGGLRKAGLE